MRIDHVSYAAEPGGLRQTAAALGEQLGVTPVDGGVHPRFGTRNVVLPLLGHRYAEVVECLDHPASDKAPFGQAVKQRSRDGGGWLCWVVAVDDLEPFEHKLGRGAVPGNRHRPDGVELKWRQLGINGLLADPQLPYFTRWQVPDDLHPSQDGPSDCALTGLQIAGDPKRVRDWLALPADRQPDPMVQFVAPKGTPGLLSVTFGTRDGSVTV